MRDERKLILKRASASKFNDVNRCIAAMMEEKKLREFLEIPLLSFYDHARLLSRALIRPSFETSSCQGERRHEDDLSPDRYKFDFIT